MGRSEGQNKAASALTIIRKQGKTESITTEESEKNDMFF
jgi:hypothetical protein